MKLLLSIFIFFIASESLGQEVIKTTMGRWVGGPCCIHGVTWRTVINVPKNSSVDIVSGYSKVDGWADLNIRRVNDSTAILTGNFQFNDDIIIEDNIKERNIRPRSKTEDENIDGFYWVIKLNYQSIEIKIDDYEKVFIAPAQ